MDQIGCIGRDPSLINETVSQARKLGESQVAAFNVERRDLERELSRWNSEIRKMLEQITPNDTDTPATARLADLQERIRGAEQRITEIREQVIGLSSSIVNECDVARAMASFDPIWDSLTPREQARIIHLLVERVDYDGASSKVSITFYPSGIKSLADELADQDTEDAA